MWEKSLVLRGLQKLLRQQLGPEKGPRSPVAIAALDFCFAVSLVLLFSAALLYTRLMELYILLALWLRQQLTFVV